MTKTCFVVSPIADKKSDTRTRSDQLLKHIIKPICDQLGYSVTRADEIAHNDRIDQTIIHNLENANLVITDLTAYNPNVFFELGYRYALKKPVIQLAMKNTQLPFDVASIRTIFYVLDNLDEVEEIKSSLKSTIESIEKSTSITVSDIESENIVDLSAILFQIQESINGLYDLIKLNNSTLIKDIMESSFSEIKKTSSSDTTEALAANLFTTFFKEGIQNPKRFQEFIKVMNAFNAPSSLE